MQNSRKKINEKKLSKYVAAFDYFDKTLIFLSTASGRIYIFSFMQALLVLLQEQQMNALVLHFP